ncbi:hypothetical protein BH11PSE3_BH11PSE3_29780 [soil metagenome]
MNRRAFLFATVAAAAVAVADTARAAPDLRVIYVGGLDCPPCTQWKNTRKAAWLASPEYRQVWWIEVEAARLRDAYQARYWPGDLTPVLDQLPRKSGTPRFLIVQDGRVVANQSGVSKWANIMTDLKKLLGE